MGKRKVEINLPTEEKTRRLEALDTVVADYIHLENEKKAVDAEYSERLKELWAKVVARQADVHNPQLELGMEMPEPPEE